MKYDRVPWGSMEGTWSTSSGFPTPSLVADASRSARRPRPRQSSSFVIVIVIVVVVVVAAFVVVVISSSLGTVEPPLILVTGQWSPRGGARHPSTAKSPGSPCRCQRPCTRAGRRVAVPILKCMHTLMNAYVDESSTESNPTTTSRFRAIDARPPPTSRPCRVPIGWQNARGPARRVGRASWGC